MLVGPFAGAAGLGTVDGVTFVESEWMGTYGEPVILGVLLASCVGLVLAGPGARRRMGDEGAVAPRRTNVVVWAGLALAAFAAFLHRDFEGGFLVPGTGFLGAVGLVVGVLLARGALRDAAG